MVALSESVLKNCLKRPPAENSRWRHNYAPPDKKLLWNLIRKSWSLFQKLSGTNCLKRPLAKKSRWRHIRLSIKPPYLGNHASQQISYYRTLPGSHSCFFRILHENAWSAPSKISRWFYIRLDIKPCFLGSHASQKTSYYETLSGNHCRSF